MKNVRPDGRWILEETETVARQSECPTVERQLRARRFLAVASSRQAFFVCLTALA